jgi:hypothetical protein
VQKTMLMRIHPRVCTATAILLCFFWGWTTAAEADNRYVTSAGSGLKNGSDWNNACDGFTGACSGNSLVRGDKYYVADGDYRIDGLVTFSTPLSGTLRVFITKATVADHGASAGWLNTMGDGDATFDRVAFQTGYWTFDGQVGTGKSAYGFKVDPQICASPTNTTQTAIFLGVGNNDMIVQHVEVAHCGEDILVNGAKALAQCLPAGSCGLSSDGIRSCNVATTTGLQIRHVYIHDLTRNGITLCATDDFLIEHVLVERLHSADSGVHGQAIQFTQPPMDNGTIRHSTFVDIAGTAALSWLGSNGQTYSNMHVYGNLFYTTADMTRYTYSPNAIYGRVQVNQATFRIYNNTFHRIVRPEPGMWGSSVSGIEVRNNLYVNSEFSSNPPSAGVVSSHNAYYDNTGAHIPIGELGQEMGNGSPFVNAAAADFRINVPTLAGTKLAAQYSLDSLGKTRGADGIWDRGAFEFGGKPLPKIPTNLKVTPQ